jgi:molecular chaperone GrpE (heat shock protein)
MSNVKSIIESRITELSQSNLTLRNENEALIKKQDQQIDEIFNEFLNVLDTFARAEEIIHERELDKDENAKMAINRLLNAKKKLLNVFEKYNVKQIDFPDNVAIDELCAVTDVEPDTSRKTGEIISIEKQGYTRQDHLLRPAEVIIVRN